MKNIFLLLFCTGLSLSLIAQEHSPISVFTRNQRGIGIVTKDSTFSIRFQFRIQNRALYQAGGETTDALFEFRVRRLRFKLEGFVLDPRLTYYIQLSFSRGDMDWRGPDDATINNSPNVVRDAIVFFNPTKDLRLGFGQTKLPGNRQRVVSSGDLQFHDRSIVNATFNIDRDFGFFAHLTKNHFALRGAITSGEGRNSTVSPNDGLAYTGRVELLPFGRFTDGNDYVEGDLAREQKPKLSLAATYSYNDRAVRQAGQLGNDLYEVSNIDNFSIDALFKFQGLAVYGEYMTRQASTPITVNSDDPSKTRLLFDGYGYLGQASYLFKNNFEIAARFAAVVPSEDIYDNPSFTDINIHEIDQYEVGVTKYLNGHRVKLQGGLIYTQQKDLRLNAKVNSNWSGVFQVELGI
jgi:hypothetical protein